MIRLLSSTIILLLTITQSAKADPAEDCKALLVYGQPTVPGQIQQVCHTAYTSFVDTTLKIPRLVVYKETGDQSLGCLPRQKSFHSDNQLPLEARTFPKDYDNTGYDLGHNAPDQDMAYDYEVLYESFSTANIAPQLPEFNRQGWESLEESVRAWALERGEIIIYVGSIVDPIPQPQTIGRGIAIPRAFYKIVIDPNTKETIGFSMNNVATPKGDVTKFITPISDIEAVTGIVFPMPDDTDKTKKVALWHTSTSTWRRKHKELCKNNG